MKNTLANYQSWDALRKEVEEKKLTSSTWSSDQKSILEIFSDVEEMGIDPSLVNIKKISNLRTIVKHLKNAILNGDAEKIRMLFSYADQKTNTELRLAVNPKKVDEIRYTRDNESNRKVYVLRLSVTEFNRIQKSTRSFFKFVETDDQHTLERR